MKNAKLLLILGVTALLAGCGGQPSASSESSSKAESSEASTSEVVTSEESSAEVSSSEESSFESSSVVATWNITLDVAEHLKDAVVLEKLTAEAGEVISIRRVNVDEYTIDQVLLDGVALEEVEGVFSFVMPEKDVTVKVTEKYIETQVTVNADDGVANYSLYSVDDLGNFAPLETVEPGVKVAIKINLAEKCYISSVKGSVVDGYEFDFELKNEYFVSDSAVIASRAFGLVINIVTERSIFSDDSVIGTHSGYQLGYMNGARHTVTISPSGKVLFDNSNYQGVYDAERDVLSLEDGEYEIYFGEVVSYMFVKATSYRYVYPLLMNNAEASFKQITRDLRDTVLFSIGTEDEVLYYGFGDLPKAGDEGFSISEVSEPNLIYGSDIFADESIYSINGVIYENYSSLDGEVVFFERNQGFEVGTYTGENGDLVLDGYRNGTYNGKAITYKCDWSFVTITSDEGVFIFKIDISEMTYEEVEVSTGAYYGVSVSGVGKYGKSKASITGYVIHDDLTLSTLDARLEENDPMKMTPQDDGSFISETSFRSGNSSSSGAYTYYTFTQILFSPNGEDMVVTTWSETIYDSSEIAPKISTPSIYLVSKNFTNYTGTYAASNTAVASIKDTVGEKYLAVLSNSDAMSEETSSLYYDGSDYHFGVDVTLVEGTSFEDEGARFHIDEGDTCLTYAKTVNSAMVMMPADGSDGYKGTYTGEDDSTITVDGFGNITGVIEGTYTISGDGSLIVGEQKIVLDLTNMTYTIGEAGVSLPFAGKAYRGSCEDDGDMWYFYMIFSEEEMTFNCSMSYSSGVTTNGQYMNNKGAAVEYTHNAGVVSATVYHYNDPYIISFTYSEASDSFVVSSISGYIYSFMAGMTLNLVA
ncbi:MAG: hypothetical protein K5694_01670 [Bacilli bacterium]|nr:hypothetical protein [Bacilli bacterium]